MAKAASGWPGVMMSNVAQRLVNRLVNDPAYVFGRFASVRSAYALGQKLSRPRSDGISISPLYSDEVGHIPLGQSGLVQSPRDTLAHRDSLRADAWSEGISLSDDAVATLRELAHHSPLKFRTGAATFGSADSLDQLSEAQRAETTTATLSDAWKDDTIRRIAGDRALTDVIQAYFGYAPKLVIPYFFWSFLSDLSLEERVARNQTVLFHYDVQGFNFAYVSFYLYPTDRRNGAHVLVEGSHKRKKAGHLLGSARISDAEAESFYGRDKIVTIERDAGQGFFEDTSCFHKALAPTDDRRLMLQFRYL